MERCLPVAAAEGRTKVDPMAKSEISPSPVEEMGLALATLPCPVAAACPMRARARVMRRGHRVSVAKGRPDRNAGVRVGYGVATMKRAPSAA